MKRNAGFALLIVLAWLIPLSCILFMMWHTTSLYYELACERKNFYQDLAYLEIGMNAVIQHCKRNWNMLEQKGVDYKVPWVQEMMLTIPDHDKEQALIFTLFLKKTKFCEANQWQVQLHLLNQQHEPQRSVSWLMSRNQANTRSEQDIFAIEYMTLHHA